MYLLSPCDFLQAWQCVCAEAVQQAEHVVQHMLAGCPAGVLDRMVTAGCNIAIIGRHQVQEGRLHAAHCRLLQYATA